MEQHVKIVNLVMIYYILCTKSYSQSHLEVSKRIGFLTEFHSTNPCAIASSKSENKSHQTR